MWNQLLQHTVPGRGFEAQALPFRAARFIVATPSSATYAEASRRNRATI
jgi:hypothetical protein